ncbi:HAD family hydrolase [Dechloromonas denitrificans]|uniref:HAD family hydrolase n=1 Tax=Dechloromonas denitrificans TaxID=281362 RepID=UPI001CF82EA4|nr:HAD family hydrolase [Dechloromonas denitrificans]UCV03346.1 HAD family hydrolase [Dechloromonas denitrificans]
MKDSQLAPEVQAVVFDAYGTLAHIRARRHAFKKLLRYGQQLGRAPQPDDAATIMTHRGGLLEAAQRLGITLPPPVYRELELDLVVELNSVTLFDDVNATLTSLKNRGLKIGLCSNLAEPYAAPLLRRLSVPFDCYAWSFSVGAIKPSPAIYAYALEQLDCPPRQVLFVGDTPGADSDGPQLMGMQARLIDRDKAERLKDKVTIALRCPIRRHRGFNASTDCLKYKATCFHTTSPTSGPKQYSANQLKHCE